MAGRRRRSTRAACATRCSRLSVSASPAILFVDLSESADPLNDINALAEVCEPGTVVIAAGQVNDVRLYRDLLASRHPGLSAEAVHPGPCCATPSPMRRLTHLRARASPKPAPSDRTCTVARDRRARRRRRLDRRDLARLAARRQGQPIDRVARSRRPFRHRRAGARPRARPRPDRRDREPEPHRRPVHRARDGQGEREALRSCRPKRRSTRRS